MGLTPAGVGADVDPHGQTILRGRYDGEFDRTNLPGGRQSRAGLRTGDTPV
jgi:hypothetical protein